MFVVNPADPGVTKHEWAMQSLTRYLKGIKDLGLSEHDEDEMLAWWLCEMMRVYGVRGREKFGGGLIVSVKALHTGMLVRSVI